MPNLAKIFGLEEMFLLGNHGCCGVPGIKDHSKEGLERSWELGQGSLIDVVLGRGGQVIMSHDVDVSLTGDNAVLFENAAAWARVEKKFVCLNLRQQGDAGRDCAERVVAIAVANGLPFAISWSSDGPFLQQIRADLGKVDTIYVGGGYAESFERDLLGEAIQAGCNGIMIDCCEPYLDWVQELFKLNRRRKKNKMVFLAHVGSEFECAPWCVRNGMGLVCDDPLEAINEILRYSY